MAKVSKKTLAAGGGVGTHFDHENPESSLAGRSIPSVILGSPIVLDKHSPVLSVDLADKYSYKGLRHEEVPLPIYRADAVGSPRRLDGTDLVKGKENLYQDVHALMTEVVPPLTQMVTAAMDKYSSRSDMVASVEMQDLPKETIQQLKYPGWFLDPPCREAAVPGPPHPLWLKALDVVMRRYAKAVPELLGLNQDRETELILQDFDPVDTMVGLPTLAAGDRTPMARYRTMQAYPSHLGKTPSSFLSGVDALGSSLNMLPGWVYSAVVSTRMGPIGPDKRIELWTLGGGTYTSSFSSAGLYNRIRLVFPAAYPMNFLLSPLYVAYSTARQRIMGLWHTPELMQQYIPLIKKQGKYSYAMDFSAMDMHIMPTHINAIMSASIRHGFPKWTSELMSELISRMGVFYPSFSGAPGQSSYFTGNFGWFSGWKLTAEVDTIFGASTFLAVMEYVAPGTIKRWELGEFVFAESGDDIQFNFHMELDAEQIKKVANQLVGAQVKVFPDVVFLKKMLPVHPDIPRLTRPFSRTIQQTFFNEDRYTGVLGGDRPDALMRLGLLARLQGLEFHPEFKTFWPDLFSIMRHLGYLKRSTPSYLSKMEKGQWSLMEGDEAAILEYATRNPAFLLRQADRAKYEPSAAQFLTLLQTAIGRKVDVLSGVDLRRMLLKALITAPTKNDVIALQSECTWMR